jgi:hypothetical protein
MPDPSKDLDQYDFSGTERAWMPREEMTGLLRQEMIAALPPGATFGFNFEGARAWVQVSKPGNTQEVLQAARAALGRDS